MNKVPGQPATSAKFLTISNLLSITRGLLVIPFVFVMLSSLPSSRIWGGVIVAVGALTDKLDGVFARKYHQETEWGRILDPLADKIGVAAGALVLLRLGDIPAWFVVCLIARDLLIFLGGMFLKLRHGVVLASNQAGKWAVNVIILTLFTILIGLHGPVTNFLIWVSVVILTVSLWLYIKRFLEVLKQPRCGKSWGSLTT